MGGSGRESTRCASNKGLRGQWYNSKHTVSLFLIFVVRSLTLITSLLNVVVSVKVVSGCIMCHLISPLLLPLPLPLLLSQLYSSSHAARLRLPGSVPRSPPTQSPLPSSLPSTSSASRLIPEFIRSAASGDHTQPVAQLLLLQVTLGQVLQVTLANGLCDGNDDLCGSLGDAHVVSEDSCLGALGGLELVVQELLL